jgi:CheY-like chemotaxis protein
MTHALIIEDNMIIARAICDRLEPLGFRSFDRTWTERQALAAASHRRPDLVVVGDEIEGGSPVGTARKVAKLTGAPVLMVTGDPLIAQRRLAEADGFEGPFLLNRIEDAVDIALSQAPA